MSRIKSKDTTPEMLVRKFLFSKGYRYRLHVNLPGKPDIIFRRKRKVIFINGCFWHQHNCKRSNIPKSNRKYWTEKLLNNKRRDKANHRELKKENWKVLIVWECEIEKNFPSVERKINKFLTK